MSEKVRNSVDNKQSLHNTTTNSKYRSLFNRSIVLKFLVGKNAPTGYNKIIIQKILALMTPIFSSPKNARCYSPMENQSERDETMGMSSVL
jgi:hypothetical protein